MPSSGVVPLRPTARWSGEGCAQMSPGRGRGGCPVAGAPRGQGWRLVLLGWLEAGGGSPAGQSVPLQGEKRKDRRFLRHHERNRAGHRRGAADWEVQTGSRRRGAADGEPQMGSYRRGAADGELQTALRRRPRRSGGTAITLQALRLALRQFGDPRSCLVLPRHRVLAGRPSSSLVYLGEGAAHLLGAVCPGLMVRDRPQQFY